MNRSSVKVKRGQMTRITFPPLSSPFLYISVESVFDAALTRFIGVSNPYHWERILQASILSPVGAFLYVGSTMYSILLHRYESVWHRLPDLFVSESTCRLVRKCPTLVTRFFLFFYSFHPSSKGTLSSPYCVQVRLCLARFVADTRIWQFGHVVYFVL